jgi:putative ABC transport system permease protein
MGGKIGEGRKFREGEREIVIGNKMKDFFDEKIKIGDTIWLQRIDGIILSAKIVGILEERANVITQITNAAIFCPIKPYYSSMLTSNRFTSHGIATVYGMVIATAKNMESVESAEREILDYLNGESDAKKLKDDEDFAIMTQNYVISRIDQVMATLNRFTIMIAAISLIVGAIGIANIMLATVVERTREIGTMMAIGAKKNHILRLFLYQAAIIGLVGAIIGCVGGVVGGWAVVSYINNYLNRLIGEGFISIPLVYPYEWFLIAIIVGIGTGIVAGILPAMKAAKMNPVDALGYE